MESLRAVYQRRGHGPGRARQGLLRELAEEELGHKVALEKMLADPAQMRLDVRETESSAYRRTIRIGDHLVVRPLGPDSTFQDVCIFASRKEQAVVRHCIGIWPTQSTGEVRDLLAAMAKDELRHKNLVEGWYEEVVYQEF